MLINDRSPVRPDGPRSDSELACHRHMYICHYLCKHQIWCLRSLHSCVLTGSQPLHHVARINCSHSKTIYLSILQQLSLQVLQTALQAGPLLHPLSALKPVLPAQSGKQLRVSTKTPQTQDD